jgi:hypothetical protein
MNPENLIRHGYALPGPGMPFNAPGYDYAQVLGRRARLKPSGENVSFDASLPRHGVLSRQLGLTDWGSDWLVMTFDEPFNHNGIKVSYCLVRARWSGCPIGSEFCPVFVLTDPVGALMKNDSWTSADFQFISWGDVELDAIQQGVAIAATHATA